MRPALLLPLLAVVACAGFLLALAAGSQGVEPAAAWQALTDGTGGLEREVILNLRLPRALAAFGVGALLALAGALLQAPYRDMAAQRGVEPTGVYVSYFAFGSPASRYGLFAGRRITAVDGMAVAGLDEFIAVVSGRRNRDSVRLTTVTWNGQVEVLTLRLDDTYWPSYQIVWHDGQWRREALLR